MELKKQCCVYATIAAVFYMLGGLGQPPTREVKSETKNVTVDNKQKSKEATIANTLDTSVFVEKYYDKTGVLLKEKSVKKHITTNVRSKKLLVDSHRQKFVSKITDKKLYSAPNYILSVYTHAQNPSLDDLTFTFSKSVFANLYLSGMVDVNYNKIQELHNPLSRYSIGFSVLF